MCSKCIPYHDIIHVCYGIPDSYINVFPGSWKAKICDYFIIATGRSTSQVKALAENVVEKMNKDFGIKAVHTDGIRDGKWAVVDFGAIMVHVFYDQVRMFYNLEKIWANGDGGNVEVFNG